MNYNLEVIKRDGSKVPFDLSKIVVAVSKAAEAVGEKFTFNSVYPSIEWILKSKATTNGSITRDTGYC